MSLAHPASVFNIADEEAKINSYVAVIDNTVNNSGVTLVGALIDREELKIGTVFPGRVDRRLVKLVELHYIKQGWGSVTCELVDRNETDYDYETTSEPDYETILWLHYWREGNVGATGIPGMPGPTGPRGEDGKSINMRFIILTQAIQWTAIVLLGIALFLKH